MDVTERLQMHLSLIRSCAGWTSKELGDKLGVSRQTISSFEKKGYHLSKIQYLAIRKLIEDEINNSPDKGGMLTTIMEVLVDHPERYSSEEINEVRAKAELIAPSVLKRPQERSVVSKAWKGILLASGIIASATLIHLLKEKE